MLGVRETGPVGPLRSVVMRAIGTLAIGLLAAALLVAGPAQAHSGPRPLCVKYRCTTVKQDRLVRVLKVASRHPEDESESEYGHWVHYAVWKRSGRAWPLGDKAVQQDSSGEAWIALAGPWIAYVEESCSHETLQCEYVVQRLNAQTGRHDVIFDGIPNEQAPLPPPGAGCLAGDTPVTSLTLAESGTAAWIEEGHVCELLHDSQVPVLLSAGPGVDPGSLLLADGFFIWREGEALRSTPAA
jgi:hypothetical protein